MSCKHRNSWLLAGLRYEWCYECGAFRMLAPVAGKNEVSPISAWSIPVGAGEENPWDKWVQATVKFKKRRGIKP